MVRDITILPNNYFFSIYEKLIKIAYLNYIFNFICKNMFFVNDIWNIIMNYLELDELYILKTVCKYLKKIENYKKHTDVSFNTEEIYDIYEMEEYIIVNLKEYMKYKNRKNIYSITESNSIYF